jgi:hypothetical protein
MTSVPSRRRVILLGSALAVGLATARSGQAQTNAALRTALKYQDTPKGPQRCDNCLHWVPGANPTARGGCKIIPGDTQIAPQGWCTAWVAAPAAKK